MRACAPRLLLLAVDIEPSGSIDAQKREEEKRTSFLIAAYLHSQAPSLDYRSPTSPFLRPSLCLSLSCFLLDSNEELARSRTTCLSAVKNREGGVVSNAHTHSRSFVDINRCNLIRSLFMRDLRFSKYLSSESKDQ